MVQGHEYKLPPRPDLLDSSEAKGTKYFRFFFSDSTMFAFELKRNTVNYGNGPPSFHSVTLLDYK